MSSQHLIYVGSATNPTFFFSSNDLMSIDTNMAVDLIGSELSIDTLTFSVVYDDVNETLEALSYATPIWYYRGASFVGKFYLKTVERYGKNQYKINAVSLIGLLEYEPHYGGMYQAMSAKAAIKEAILSNGLGLYRFGKYALPKTSTAGTTSVALGANYKGNGLADSNTNSAFEVFFWAYGNAEYGVDKVVWLSSINGYGSMSGKYVLGVTVTKTNNTPSSEDITVKVYCQYNGNDSPEATFAAKYGDFIDVKIFPASGYLTYSVSASAAQRVYFSAISPSHKFEVPLFSSLGVNVLNDVITPQTTTFDFGLLNLYIAGASGSPLYLDAIALKDTFSGDVYLRNAVTYYTQIAPGYSVSGNEVAYSAYDSAYNIRDDIPELYEAAESIEWADGIDNMTVSGWIRAGAKRDVLHQLLFALNLNLYKSESGSIIINRLPSEVQDAFDGNEIYDTGRVESVEAPQYVELTEHAYTASGETETVFDNSDATVAGGYYVVEYDRAPVYGAPAPTGLTLYSYNANAAVVSGKGSLTAQTYIHSQRTLRSKVNGRPDGSTVAVSDATAVTFLNSSNVLSKLLAYYGGAVKIIRNAILASALCGRKYTFAHPFGGETSGYLAEVSVVGSATTKSNCTFVTGFAPISIGNEFEHYVILTGSGVFTVPAGVTKLHVVLIGGGTGGDSGYAGEDGGSNAHFVSASAARGGDYGSNGAGGNVYEFDVSSPAASYAYACGVGGVGGAISHDHNANNPGSAGTDTTFGSFSSGSGTPTPYTNILNGDVFAAQMPKWNDASGKGGDGGYKTINDSSNPTQVTQYQAGGAYNLLTGSTLLGGASKLGATLGGVYQWVGGSGGGAALNANGAPGGDYAYISNERVISADGGDGANATYTPPKATAYNPKFYGYGGMGGPGGGAGGCAGYDGAEETTFTGGAGGYGAKGGDGGDGCVLVFY